MKLQKRLIVSLTILLVVSPQVFGGPTYVSGSVAYFTGNQSGGIQSGIDFSCPPIYTLYVYDLTANIAPAENNSGIGIVREAGAGTAGAESRSGINAHAGNGGGGYPGGEVIGSTWVGPTVNFTGGNFEIFSSGLAGRGIYAKSIGGTGGAGGYANSVFASAWGGAGGYGGVGMPVTVTSNGGIHATGGFFALGIWAVNEGGTGGAGGATDSLVAAYGGAGGVGGSDSVVTVHNDGDINTGGVFSAGILATSTGGDGGVGGSAHTGGDAIGGQGGDGGNGGIVIVTNDGSITADGIFTLGVAAASAGGTGGDGGSADSIGYGQGGNGGRGGTAGPVQINNQGTITITSTLDSSQTKGFTAGILGQSLGGIGGNGGSGSSVVGVGGNALGGGSADSVYIGNTGIIDATGLATRGILAQSIGGFDGSGGSGSGMVGWGGSGTSSGNGAPATVGNSGAITVTGDGSFSILAQSIGGGGGDAGYASGGVAIGGTGSAAGSGGTVTVTNTGTLQTFGTDAQGLAAQSIGGGGGSGGVSAGLVALGGSGNSSGSGGSVTVTNNGQITTTGDSSDSIFAQSIGGGGGILEGAGSINVDFFGSIGGSGGAGGSGSTVTVNNNSGHLQTSGDDASGILAQSIGGGGGRSGWSFTGFATPPAADLMVSASEADIGVEAASLPDWLDWLVGASGGGGDGGQVNVTTGATAVISTEGAGSHGVHAQSVGGGGGTGKIVESSQFFVSVAIGGEGGTGGRGGAVNVTNNGTITTQGKEAEGLFAQSVGGGGGTGGSVKSYTAGVDYTVNVALGGQGGTGGAGGTVTLTNNGQVTTHGENAHGLHGQSIGGGGGSGGNAVTWTANLGLGLLKIPTLTAGLTMGAGGGSGGSADKVTILSTGGISTAGLRSYGILAQSVGGGGGDGGSSMAGLLAFGTDIVANVALGGKAGVAGNGADVDVDSDGVIETQGDFSHGILAQSIGGGGGAGGNSSILMAAIDVPTGISPEDLLPRAATINVGVGGASSPGGAGGLVDVESTGAISTKGDFANGILAQSVGGGGGAAGNSTEQTLGLSLNPLPSIGVAADLAVGGFAYTGGSSIPNDGGSVIVHNSGAIVTEGAFANGILAQSVGGGGGAGGDSTKMTADLSADLVGELLAPTTASWDISVGGFGGKGGAGGVVGVDNSAGITTMGHFANGILAQSIGGGGGAGGERTKIANELSGVPSLGLLSAIDPSIALAVGGFGSNGGAGGGVDVSNSGAITTAGHFANGILAQSVGGGGGAGGNLATLDITAIPDMSVDFGFSGGSFSLGGLGGLGGAGGVVTLTNSNGGDITTGGHFANGILAQSIGGGGGTNGSIATSSLVLAGGESSSTLLKGAGAGAGNGGAVTVENSADIVTHGGFAHGILAQSIGGGGGFGGISESGGAGELDLNLQATGVFVENAGFGTAFAGSAGGSGSAGAVSVTNTNTGAITTTGEMSHGILAQSAAGTGAAGPVTVTLAGDIRAYGAKSHGIYAQSAGGGGNGNITINNGGIVQGGSAGDLADGSDAGVGVNIDGGANNTLTNAAAGSISALSGKAIVGGSGNETIHNYGTIAGTVELGGGTNAFHNYSGARFDSGLTVDLGAGGALTNSGILSPGGLGNIANTTLTGDFVQLNSGTLEIEIGGFDAGLIDSLNISGILSAGTEAAGVLSATELSPAGGNVHFSFLPGYDIFADIDPGESLALLFLTVEDNPEFLSTSLFSYEFFGGPSGFQFDVFQQGGGLYVQAENVVPVPGACLLGFLGLGVAGWKLRKMCS